MRPDINFTPKMTPNGRPCTPSKYFNHAGTRWGANNFGKSGGGRSNFKILWLDHEIPKFLQDFLSIAIRVKIGFRTLPESSNIFVGVTPPHLAMERFRALLVKGLNLTAQPLLMEYEKEILRLAIFCKLFWDWTINIITLTSECLWWLPST